MGHLAVYLVGWSLAAVYLHLARRWHWDTAVLVASAWPALVGLLLWLMATCAILGALERTLAWRRARND